MQTVFLQAFHQSIGGLMHCANLPPFRWADESVEKVNYQSQANLLSNFISCTILFQGKDIFQKFRPTYKHLLSIQEISLSVGIVMKIVLAQVFEIPTG